MGSLSISSCWLEAQAIPVAAGALGAAGSCATTEMPWALSSLASGLLTLIPSDTVGQIASSWTALVRDSVSPFIPLISVLLEPFRADAVQTWQERLVGGRRWLSRISPRGQDKDTYWQSAAQPASPRVMAGPSDELLVQRWQEGDRVAFEALVRRYQHVAYTVCLRYLRNPQSAEETAQDVFVALYRKLHEFRGESSFKSWFYRVLTNHCHNRHKAGVRRAEGRHSSLDAPLDPSDADSGKLDLPDSSPDPEARLAEAQRQALIDASLADIGEEARMILLLREGQGMAYEDIGDALQLNSGTVKSRIHRARAELKAAVERRMAAAGFTRLG